MSSYIFTIRLPVANQICECTHLNIHLPNYKVVIFHNFLCLVNIFYLPTFTTDFVVPILLTHTSFLYHSNNSPIFSLFLLVHASRQHHFYYRTNLFITTFLLSLMSTSRRRIRTGRAKERTAIRNVTCTRCGQVQTETSINGHYPQCTGSVINETVHDHDTIHGCVDVDDNTNLFSDHEDVPSAHEDLFFSRHLSVDSLRLLANNDYDDDDSEVDFLASSTGDHASVITGIVGDASLCSDSDIPISDPPSPSSTLMNSPNDDDDNNIQEDINEPPLGSLEVSVEFEVAQNYGHKEFTRQEQSMARLLSLFTGTGCRLSLFDEVLSQIKKDVKLGYLDLEKVATRKTFLSRLRLKFPDIGISSTDVPFPTKKRSSTVEVYCFCVRSSCPVAGHAR